MNIEVRKIRATDAAQGLITKRYVVKLGVTQYLTRNELIELKHKLDTFIQNF